MEQEEKKIEPRYMTSTKKHYYLAAVNENVEHLKKEEIDGLTRVLIELKSQYDIISREHNEKKKQTEELEKKIKSLEKTDEKSKKKISDTENKSQNLANAIETKKTCLNECIYRLKTMQKTIEKLKNDNFVIQKKIMQNENIKRCLENNKGKEEARKTQLKEKINKVYSQITDQQNKNIFEKGEQNLQLQYYRTIIDQKKMFIRSDDERKERQKKIAEEAKNNSADKQEVERRKVLGLLKLYNIFLESEMEKALLQNEKLENTYREIREICGSPSLRVMINKILTKEYSYNDELARVNELQNEIDTYEKDNIELEEKLQKLKIDVLCSEKDEKSISTIPTSILEENENKLIEEEERLTNEVVSLKEKLEHINLTYRKVKDNIGMFAKELKIMEDWEKKDENKLIKKNFNVDSTNENSLQQITLPCQSTQYDPNSQLNNNNVQSIPEEKEKEKEKDKESSINDNLSKNENNNMSLPAPNSELLKNFSQKSIDSKKPPTINIPVSSENAMQNNVSNDTLVNSDEIIKTYNDFLNMVTKKFERYFLCFNKEHFISVMAEKGIKKVQNNDIKTSYNDNRPVKKKKQKDTIQAAKPGSDKFDEKEIEVDEDDLVVSTRNEDVTNIRRRKKKQGPSEDIFERFLEEQENKTNEFINERELKKKKKIQAA